MNKQVNFFVLIVFFLFFVGNVSAGFDCIVDPSVIVPPVGVGTPAPTPYIRCIDLGASGGTHPNLKECLQGGQTYSDLDACKSDPRFQLRNFAPMLNFPNIGSMLNLGTALVTTGAGLLCGIFMFLGVFNYMTAGGDPKKIESARNRMIFSGIGLVIVLFAYTIVKIILDITSTNTVGF